MCVLVRAQQAHRKSSVQWRNNLLRNGRREASTFIFSVLCGGVCGLDNNITCSPGEVYDPHHLLLFAQIHERTHTHTLYIPRHAKAYPHKCYLC